MCYFQTHFVKQYLNYFLCHCPNENRYTFFVKGDSSKIPSATSDQVRLGVYQSRNVIPINNAPGYVNDFQEVVTSSLRRCVQGDIKRSQLI